MQKANKLFKLFEILYFIATLCDLATTYKLQDHPPDSHPYPKQVYRASSLPQDLPQSCVNAWQSEAILQLCATDFDLKSFSKEATFIIEDSDNSEASASSESGSVKLQTFLKQNRLTEIEIYYQTDTSLVDCLKFVNQEGNLHQYGSQCIFDVQSQQNSSELPEGLLIGIETQLEKKDKCSLSLIFSDNSCIQSLLDLRDKPIAVSTRLGKPLELSLPDFQSKSGQTCDDLSVSVKDSQILSTAISNLDTNDDIIILDGCKLIINPQNCSKVGTHLVTLTLNSQNNIPADASDLVQLQKEQLEQEIQLEIEIRMCALKHEGKRVREKVKVHPNYDTLNLLSTLEMWEEKLDHDDAYVNDDDSAEASYCEEGIRWKFKQDSPLKQGQFKDGVFELNTEHLLNDQSLEIELLYDHQCPQIYNLTKTLVEISMQIELDDQLDRLKLDEQQKMITTQEIARNPQNQSFEDLERSLDEDCSKNSWWIEPRGTSTNSRHDVTVYANGANQDMVLTIKDNCGNYYDNWFISVPTISPSSTDFTTPGQNQLTFNSDDTDLIGQDYDLTLVGSSGNKQTENSYWKVSVGCATTEIWSNYFPADYSDLITYTTTDNAYSVGTYWTGNINNNKCNEQIQVSYNLQKCTDNSFSDCSDSSVQILKKLISPYDDWVQGDDNKIMQGQVQYQIDYDSTADIFMIENQDNANIGFYQISLKGWIDPNNAGTLVGPTPAQIVQVEVLSSCYLVEFDDTVIAPVTMSLDMVKSFSLPNFGYSLSGSSMTSCGTQTIEFGNLGELAAELVDNTSGQYTIEFDSTQMTQGQELSIPITVTLDNYGPYGPYSGVTREYELQVYVYQAVLTEIESYTFTIGDGPVFFDFSTSFVPEPATPFEMSIAGYSQPTTYDELLPNATRSDLPASSNFYTKVESEKIEFYTDLSSTVGTHIFEYSVSFKDYPSWYHVSQFFEVIVEEVPTNFKYNSAPRFESLENWVSPSYVGCGQKFTLELPPIVDDNPEDEASLHKVKLGPASVFAEFNEQKNQIEIPSNVITEDLNGSYNIKVELIDSNGKIGTHQMDLIVACNSAFIINEDQLEEIEEEYKAMGDKIIIIEPQIVKVNGIGEVLIGFKTPMTFQQPENDQNRQLANQESEKGFSCQDTLIKMADGSEKPLVELNVISYDQSEKINYTYNCTDFLETMVKLQVKYTNPGAISISEPRDRIQITFWGLQQYFKPNNGGRIIEGTGMSLIGSG